jgi:type IV secretory pathway VirB2 component (pilin)
MKRNLRPTFFLLTALVMSVTTSVFASTGAAGAGLAWESPLQKVQQSLSGPVAFVICVIGIVVAFATVMFGGELNEMARKAIYVVAAGAVMVGAVPTVSTLFNVSGALI